MSDKTLTVNDLIACSGAVLLAAPEPVAMDIRRHLLWAVSEIQRLSTASPAVGVDADEADFAYRGIYGIAIVVSGDQPTADEIAKRAVASGFRSAPTTPPMVTTREVLIDAVWGKIIEPLTVGLEINRTSAGKIADHILSSGALVKVPSRHAMLSEMQKHFTISIAHKATDVAMALFNQSKEVES